MGFGDLGDAIVIVIVFLILQFLLSLTAGIADIKKNWDKYKCNPAVLPFASTFGHSTKDTFNECIKNTQVDFMSVFLEPIYASLFYFANNGAIFTEMFQRLKLFGDAENTAMGDFADITNNRLYGLVNATNIVFLNIVDTFSKLSASIAILYNSIDAALYTGKQASCELPGTMISVATGIEVCNKDEKNKDEKNKDQENNNK